MKNCLLQSRCGFRGDICESMLMHSSIFVTLGVLIEFLHLRMVKDVGHGQFNLKETEERLAERIRFAYPLHCLE